MTEKTTINTTELDPADPMARLAQTFPRLSQELASRVAAYGIEEEHPTSTTLFERGQRNADFFLVLDGGIEILDVDAAGNIQQLRLLGERQFTGEMNLFNGRQIARNRAHGRTDPARTREARRFPQTPFE